MRIIVMIIQMYSYGNPDGRPSRFDIGRFLIVGGFNIFDFGANLIIIMGSCGEMWI